MSDGVIINLCPTGMVPTRDRVPHVPVTPDEIAADVRRCRDAGASMVHLHARDDDEAPTWRAERFGEVIDAVLAEAPDVIVVATTSGRGWSELSKRSEVLSLTGRQRPEMASLTLGSMNFARSASVNAPQTVTALGSAMAEAGIVPELEVFDVGMADTARRLADEGVLAPPHYVNILLGSQGTASLSAANIAAALAALPRPITWSLAGIGRQQTPAIAAAVALGGHVRVGLEDNPYLDWSSKEPATNPALVERAVRLAGELGRQPVEPDGARELIGLSDPAERTVAG